MSIIDYLSLYLTTRRYCYSKITRLYLSRYNYGLPTWHYNCPSGTQQRPPYDFLSFLTSSLNLKLLRTVRPRVSASPHLHWEFSCTHNKLVHQTQLLPQHIRPSSHNLPGTQGYALPLPLSPHPFPLRAVLKPWTPSSIINSSNPSLL